MMRVPGSRADVPRAKAEGADIPWSTRRWTRCGWPRANPGKDVGLFAIGFETTASLDRALKRAKLEGVENFLCVCNHVTSWPPLRACSIPGPCAWTASSARSGSSTIVGVRPFEFPEGLRQAAGHAGFEPLDILQGIQMILAQIAAGRASWRPSTPGSSPRGQPRRARGDGGGVRAPAALRVARARFISRAACGSPTPYAVSTPTQVRDARRAGRRPKACQCGEASRRDQTVGVQSLRTAARPSTRSHVHGLAEGACASYYQYGRLRSRAGVV